MRSPFLNRAGRQASSEAPRLRYSIPELQMRDTKVRSRPFQVEVRHAKGHSKSQTSRWDVAHSDRRLGLLAGASDGKLVLAAGSVPSTLEAVPPKPRVLPDLRASVVTQCEEKPSAGPPTKRSKRNTGRLQFAARAPDQDRIAGEPDATEPSAALQKATGTANFNRRVPAKAASDPPLPQAALPARSRAEAALRFSRRAKQDPLLRRSERWKERRLPRVCWDKPGRPSH